LKDIDGGWEEAIPYSVQQHIELREGNIAYSYLDTLGILTGGVGHRLSPDEADEYPEGTDIPELVRRMWLEEDLFRAMRSANRQVKQVNLEDDTDRHCLRNALVSVNFQLGTGWYRKFVRAWKALKEHDWSCVAKEIVWKNPDHGDEMTLWYHQTPTRVEDFIEALRCLKS